MKIIYLESAELALDEIYSFLSQRSEKAAINLYNKILDEIDKLTSFPKMGVLYHSIIGIRSILIENKYRVLYFIEDKTIYIILVWDCRRNPKEFKKKILAFTQKN
ncbi:type II toxin-antitoxin system RelE/ParE family toxin [Dysgonomonas sp. 521]|uniref:type II toxin-antitoxin system RelE/ParE family toxin n=1 Tax=Dysgonomonas sp. 521 TaxID=2302932 RepID=UPI0013D52490|nr:type II toxin-antitoxin system RelE/ParE family toxin [Dysgonomonas sp. 521]NDV96098.1 type II toxin-antitoxin system RelE/ParE family toxin [Dysgonomonas sp. 521]